MANPPLWRLRSQFSDFGERAQLSRYVGTGRLIDQLRGACLLGLREPRAPPARIRDAAGVRHERSADELSVPGAHRDQVAIVQSEVTPRRWNRIAPRGVLGAARQALHALVLVSRVVNQRRCVPGSV